MSGGVEEVADLKGGFRKENIKTADVLSTAALLRPSLTWLHVRTWA
jgi:hypothetical protein